MKLLAATPIISKKKVKEERQVNSLVNLEHDLTEESEEIGRQQNQNKN